jgi:hypothetical protein
MIEGGPEGSKADLKVRLYKVRLYKVRLYSVTVTVIVSQSPVIVA